MFGISAPPRPVNPAPAHAARLERVAFSASRLAEFCTRRELERQTGHSAVSWPIYLVKEFLDNGLDAAEEAEVAPSIDIEVTADRITVADNALGIPPATIERLLRLDSRTSSRSHHIAPIRGAQGQALSTAFVMAHALAPGCGRAVIIEAQGLVHTIALHVDALSGDPRLVHHVSAGSVSFGTRVTVEWPESACTILEAAEDEFLPLVLAYVLANPHAHFTLRTPARAFCSTALDPLWEKWGPTQPTSPLWYTPETFGRLLRAQINDDREQGNRRPLRDFLRQFDGLSGTTRRKAVLDAADLYRASLGDLVHEDDLDTEVAATLLRAMQREVRPVKPARLGTIGEAFLRRRMVEQWGGAAFVYAKAAGVDGSNFPYVVEGAFVWTPKSGSRRLIQAANFASTPNLSFRLEIWQSADAVLEARYAGQDKPICIFLNVVHPQLTFTDLGKTRISLPWEVGFDLRRVIEKITDSWERQCRREIKDKNAELKRQDALDRKPTVSVKDAVYKHLPAVYAKVAGDIGAVCRQLFYGLRPLVLAETGRQDLDDEYIQYGLIPDFITEHPDLCADWTVLFDDRGALHEPHTGISVGLGTRNVRDYCRTWGPPIAAAFRLQPPTVGTYGADGRYGGIFFCEKEGFNELWRKVQLDALYDVGIASNKGTSVCAGRQLLEEAGCAGVTIFALVDFDYNGFEIAATLSRDTRRYKFKKPPQIIHIGLRLADVKRLGLQSEPVSYGKRDLGKIRENLRLNGANEEEIAFLVDGKQRVEINAVPTLALIEMIEAAFRKAGLQKIIPKDDVLAEYFTKEIEYRNARKALEQAISRARSKRRKVAVPDDLKEQVARYLKRHPTAAWDDAIRAIVRR